MLAWLIIAFRSVMTGSLLAKPSAESHRASLQPIKIIGERGGILAERVDQHPGVRFIGRVDGHGWHESILDLLDAKNSSHAQSLHPETRTLPARENAVQSDRQRTGGAGQLRGIARSSPAQANLAQERCRVQSQIAPEAYDRHAACFKLTHCPPSLLEATHCVTKFMPSTPSKTFGYNVSRPSCF